MHIKKVIEFVDAYCALVVTDNHKNIECICEILPMQEEAPPRGTKISMLNAFFLHDNPKITVINNKKRQKFKLFKKGLFVGMSYALRGKVIDTEKFILQVYDFYISLEYLFSAEYPNPLEFIYKAGDWIELVVDRFDAVM